MLKHSSSSKRFSLRHCKPLYTPIEVTMEFALSSFHSILNGCLIIILTCFCVLFNTYVMLILSMKQCAKRGARCDYGLYVGASDTNATIIPPLAQHAAALKMYLNDTYTTLKMDSMQAWKEVRVLLEAFVIAD